MSSNLDRAIAQRLQAVIGEEVAKAEKMVRAKVDSLVAAKVEPVKRQVAEVRTQAEQRLAAERKRLDEVESAAPGGAQAAHRRAGAGDQAAEDQAVIAEGSRVALAGPPSGPTSIRG